MYERTFRVSQFAFSQLRLGDMMGPYHVVEMTVRPGKGRRTFYVTVKG
jgi:hypothetical protein